MIQSLLCGLWISQYSLHQYVHWCLCKRGLWLISLMISDEKHTQINHVSIPTHSCFGVCWYQQSSLQQTAAMDHGVTVLSATILPTSLDAESRDSEPLLKLRPGLSFPSCTTLQVCLAVVLSSRLPQTHVAVWSYIPPLAPPLLFLIEACGWTLDITVFPCHA